MGTQGDEPARVRTVTHGRHADDPARPSGWQTFWRQRQTSLDLGRSAPPLASSSRAHAASRLARRRRRGRDSLQDQWSAAAARAYVPADAFQRLAYSHPELGDEHLHLVGDALLQWVRIEGRMLPATFAHALPSRAVEALWLALRADLDGWASFAASFPEDLGHLASNPGFWMPPESLVPLRASWTDAFTDERPVGTTPLLFCVDAAIGASGGRSYQGYCARHPCRTPPGLLCLHLPVPEMPPLMY